MQNQKTLENLYRLAYADEIKMAEESEEELYHHGVLGMSWGDRHGPPYPLSGIDKKVARAEAKRKREKERRIKKLQRAAKKARRQKKRDERKQEKIAKLKQKIAKKGDVEALRKNAKYFTNEEIQYIVERHDQLAASKRPSKKSLSKEERMERFMKRAEQFAFIAANATKALGAVKEGINVVNAYKDASLKDVQAKEKEWGIYAKEFDMRFKIDKDDAQGFLDSITNNQRYAQSRNNSNNASSGSDNTQAQSNNRPRIRLGNRNLRSSGSITLPAALRRSSGGNTSTAQNEATSSTNNTPSLSRREQIRTNLGTANVTARINRNLRSAGSITTPSWFTPSEGYQIARSNERVRANAEAVARTIRRNFNQSVSDLPTQTATQTNNVIDFIRQYGAI